MALDFDAASVRKLESVAAGLRAAEAAPESTRLKWSPRNNLHLTLKFLGEVPHDVATLIAAQIPHWAAKVGPFSAKLRAATAFPNPRKAETIVAIVADDAEFFSDLASLVADYAATLGVARETRPFRSHVTLARVKAPLDARGWLAAATSQVASIEVACPTLALYRTDRLEHGSMYTAIARAAVRT